MLYTLYCFFNIHNFFNVKIPGNIKASAHSVVNQVSFNSFFFFPLSLVLSNNNILTTSFKKLQGKDQPESEVFFLFSSYSLPLPRTNMQHDNESNLLCSKRYSLLTQFHFSSLKDFQQLLYSISMSL